MPKLDAYWMPFTANRQFKSAPRLVSKAEGMYFTTPEGRRVLDGVAGLWCVNVGYGQQALVDAAARQMRELPFYNAFFQTATVPAITVPR